MSRLSVQTSQTRKKRSVLSVIYATALSLTEKGFLEEALRLFTSAKKLALQARDYDSALKAVFQMAHIYGGRGEGKTAEELLQWGRKYLPKCSRRIQGKFYVSALASLYLYQGRAQEVIRLLNWAIEEYKNSLPPIVLGVAYSHLGTAHIHEGNYVWGRRILEEALPYLKTHLPSYVLVLNNIVHACIKLGDYDVAETYLQEALRLAQSNGLRMELAYVRQNQAELHLRKGGDLRKALSYAEESIRLFREMEMSFALPYPYLIQAQIYDRLGEPDNALLALKVAREYALKNQHQADLEEIEKVERELRRSCKVEESQEDGEVSLEEISLSDPLAEFLDALDRFMQSHTDLLETFRSLLQGLMSDPKYIRLMVALQERAPRLYYAILTHDTGALLRYLEETSDYDVLLAFRELQTLIRSQMQYVIVYILQKMKAEDPYIRVLLGILDYSDETLNELALEHLLERVNFPIFI